jgi:hypothetical protein
MAAGHRAGDRRIAWVSCVGRGTLADILDDTRGQIAPVPIQG